MIIKSLCTLKSFKKFTSRVHSLVKKKQNKRKFYADKKHRPHPNYNHGDQVWVTLYTVSKSKQKHIAKFMLHRDGSYIILT